MIVLDKIKHVADPNYFIYENNIIKYYNDNERDYNTSCLKDYIYRFYVQPDYASAHNNKYEIICSIHDYVDKLFSSFYNHYKKKSMIHTVTRKLIDDILLEDTTISYTTIEYIIKNTGYNKSIEEFIKLSLESTKQLPKFALWEVNKIDVYVFLATLIDYVISQ